MRKGAVGIRMLWLLPPLLLLFLFVSGTASAADKTHLKILAMGDSTTAGTPGFYSPAEKPPDGEGDRTSQYAYWILRGHPDWTVYNRGVRGQRADQIFSRYRREAASYPAYVIVVLAGVNDLYQGYPVEHVEAYLERIYDFAQSQNVPVMVCTILPYNISTAEVRRRMARVNEWIRHTAQARGFLFCDTYKVLEDPARPGDLLASPDGIHPDPDGYRKMGEAIAKVLEEW